MSWLSLSPLHCELRLSQQLSSSDKQPHPPVLPRAATCDESSGAHIITYRPAHRPERPPRSSRPLSSLLPASLRHVAGGGGQPWPVQAAEYARRGFSNNRANKVTQFRRGAAAGAWSRAAPRRQRRTGPRAGRAQSPALVAPVVTRAGATVIWQFLDVGTSSFSTL